MPKINLRECYPDTYSTDIFLEVSDEIQEILLEHDRLDAAQQRKQYRYKAYYSLDYGNGIEGAALERSPIPEDILEEKQRRQQVFAAVMSLPEKQARRVYARFYLGLTCREIAKEENVNPRCVRESIQFGLKKLAKLLA